MIRSDLSNGNGDTAQATVDPAPAEPAPPPPGVPAVPQAEKDSHEIKTASVVLQAVLAIVIVGVASLIAFLLIQQKTAPSQLNAARSAPVVEVVVVANGDADSTVRGFGRVRAATQLSAVPQVGGRVVSIHPQLRPGGTIPAGETILEIDPTDYEIALEQRQADLARAQAALTRVDARQRSAAATVAAAESSLETTRAEANVARDEYLRVNPDGEVPPLVAREPQLRSGEAQLESARAGLDDVEAEEAELQAAVRQAEAAVRAAEASLERTKLALPEGGGPWRVAEESVDVGQSVTAGQSVATIYDASSLEVPIPLDDADLGFVEVPGSSATLDVGGVSVNGTVDRTAGQIGATTQLVEVIVSLDEVGDSAREFVPGRFVEAVIAGRTVSGVARLPREAIRRDEDTGEPAVHVVQGSGTLKVVDVEVVRRAGDDLFVRGLGEGDRVVLTRLELATDGMQVQVAGETPTTRPTAE